MVTGWKVNWRNTFVDNREADEYLEGASARVISFAEPTEVEVPRFSRLPKMLSFTLELELELLQMRPLCPSSILIYYKNVILLKGENLPRNESWTGSRAWFGPALSSGNKPSSPPHALAIDAIGSGYSSRMVASNEKSRPHFMFS
jgi:hypothetical protein